MEKIDRAYIDGDWRLLVGPEHPLVDPATESPVGSVVISGSRIVDKAVTAASRAFEQGWGATPQAKRVELLKRFAAEMNARSEDLANCISAEIGTPIDFSRKGQVAAALWHLQTTIAALEGLDEDRALTTDPQHRVRYEPIGVAALITPWNWPLNQVVLKVAAAIAAGCSMVLKPSEWSSRTALILCEVIEAAGLPRGVFNMVPGDARTGQNLVDAPKVDVISFTGSTRAGMSIASSAAKRFARTTLELGGKSPNILFPDCDLPLAVQQGVAHCFRNAGQSCNAASRMLVAREIYDEAVELAAHAARATEVGLPGASGAHIGPLVNRAQFDRVQAMIKEAQGQGAQCVAGGPGRMVGFDKGYFARPTVFADVAPDMSIFREEVFGPVLSITPFDSEEEAIRLANGTGYGLAGYIQTADNERADRVSRALKVGMVQVNGTSREEGAPFGGTGRSGWGREAGVWGIRSFQEIKSISGAALFE